MQQNMSLLMILHASLFAKLFAPQMLHYTERENIFLLNAVKYPLHEKMSETSVADLY
jgi:hypothetical protein